MSIAASGRRTARVNGHQAFAWTRPQPPPVRIGSLSEESAAWRSERKPGGGRRILEERLAIDDWNIGLAR